MHGAMDERKGARPLHPDGAERAARWLLSHRWVGVLAVLGLTALLGTFATRVRPDYSVELLFPVWDPARQIYDRYKEAFPHEDTRAVVVVSGPDLFGRESLVRLRALEADLARVSGVEAVVGPLSARTVVLDGDEVRLEPLLPGPDVSERHLAYAREVLTTDRLFAWNVAAPDASAVSIGLRLEPTFAGTDEGRQRFAREAREVLARHPWVGGESILSGVPAIRARFAQLILDDLGRMLPAALGAVLVLLFLAFRSVASVLASFATILVALVWTYGVLGLLGYPMSMMVSILPIIVIVISVSDSVHVVNEFLAGRRAGLEVREALVKALGATAVPCLLTEVVIACGFLSLTAVNILAVLHFGVASALAMLLVWLANMLVLPLALSLAPERAPRPERASREVEPPVAVRTFERFARWVGAQVVERPRRVVLVASMLVLASLTAATRLDTIAYVFADLRPGSDFARELRVAERAHGGLLPLAVFVESLSPEKDSALEPELVRLVDRGAEMLRGFPEVREAHSIADSIRHAKRALGGDEELPGSRRELVRHLARGDARAALEDVLSPDGRALAAPARMVDAGSARVEEMFRDIDAWVAREQALLDAAPGGPRARVHVTGQARIFKDVNDTLMEGLVGSFAGSLLVSLLVMCVVLRSWRLGLVGLVPNVVPVLLVLGFMALTGIALKPVTVVVFSITLVIAEDDTIQFLVRFGSHYRRALARGAHPGRQAHQEAALGCMREVALPLCVTSTCVSAGFLLLCLSEFLGPVHVGMLIGATLLAAVFADLFLTPLLLIRFQPLASRRPAESLSVHPAA
jgi:uncharacterized protein